MPPRASTSGNKGHQESASFVSTGGQSTSQFVNAFWQHQITVAETTVEDFKHQGLPLARIKKVMKSDPEVKMISSEVTVLFEKACQIFIQELTSRSHLNSLSSRRRTLSRPDVAQAISKSDIFDFLIDIVPREGEDAGEEEVGENGEEEEARGGKGKGRKTGRGKAKVKRGRVDEVSHDQEGGRSGIIDEVGLEGAGEIEFSESLNGAGLKRYSDNGEEAASKRIRVEEGLSEDYRVGANSSYLGVDDGIDWNANAF